MYKYQGWEFPLIPHFTKHLQISGLDLKDPDIFESIPFDWVRWAHRYDDVQNQESQTILQALTSSRCWTSWERTVFCWGTQTFLRKVTSTVLRDHDLHTCMIGRLIGFSFPWLHRFLYRGRWPWMKRKFRRFPLQPTRGVGSKVVKSFV